MTWWVLQTGAKGDFFAHERLSDWTRWGNFGHPDNVLPYLPYTLVTKPVVYRGVDTGRKKQVREALFPKYMFLDVNTDDIVAKQVEEVPYAGRLIRRMGDPLVVSEKHMLPLLMRGEREGKTGEVDKTKRSFWFKGKVGDAFTFMSPSSFAGFRGWITSISDLDIGGTVMANVLMFNKMHEVVVSTAHIGSVVRDESRLALKAAA